MMRVDTSLAVEIETKRPVPTARTICAVVVTYYPDLGLLDRLEKVARQVNQTVIVDNGSPSPCISRLMKIAEKLAAHLILHASNEGLARGLNAGAEWAASQGYQWILTLDQDTTVAPDMIQTLADVSRTSPFPERLAVIGSNYRDKTNGRVLREDVIGSSNFRGQEMIAVLTSGSLVSVESFRALHGFRDEFFIDCVDFEYCLRARAHGFHVAMTFKPVMEHGIGYLTEHHLLWKKVGTSNHSPVRQYFMTRNTLILAREYVAKEPRWILGYLWAWLKSVVVLCLFEAERLQKIRNIIRGCFDGVLGRTHWKPS
jgi:rhamnosyltransferase